jgi:hypothetical protein
METQLMEPAALRSAGWCWSTRAIDDIREGATPAELRERGSVAVWAKLCSTAASAQTAGIPFVDWRGEVLSPRSKLGRQVQLTSKGRTRSQQAVNRDLEKAWAQAGGWLATRPAAWSDDERRAAVAERVARARLLAEDPDAPLDDAERAVLLAVAAEQERRGLTQVALSKRRLVELSGVPEWTARKAQQRLVDRGVVRLVARGRRGKPDSGVEPRAAILALPAREVPLWTPVRPMTAGNGAPRRAAAAVNVGAAVAPALEPAAPIAATSPTAGVGVIPTQRTAAAALDDTPASPPAQPDAPTALDAPSAAEVAQVAAWLRPNLRPAGVEAECWREVQARAAWWGAVWQHGIGARDGEGAHLVAQQVRARLLAGESEASIETLVLAAVAARAVMLRSGVAA